MWKSGYENSNSSDLGVIESSYIFTHESFSRCPTIGMYSDDGSGGKGGDPHKKEWKVSAITLSF